MAHYANDADRAVITGSDVSQLSYESDQFGGGHGVFTFYLLKGLHGEADANKDGTVTAGELYSYVARQCGESHQREPKPHGRAGNGRAHPAFRCGAAQYYRSSTDTPARSRRESGSPLR